MVAGCWWLGRPVGAVGIGTGIEGRLTAQQLVAGG